jgi:hypothetical protein
VTVKWIISGYNSDMNDPDVDDYFQTEIPLTPEQDAAYNPLGRVLIWTIAVVAVLAVVVALIR